MNFIIKKVILYILSRIKHIFVILTNKNTNKNKLENIVKCKKCTDLGHVGNHVAKRKDVWIYFLC